MEAARVLTIVSSCLDGRGVPWALAGGWALHALGYSRLTRDLDIVADDTLRREVTADLEAGGFEVLHETEGFTNLLGRDPGLGRLDLIWVEGETSRRLFSQARLLPSIGGIQARVPRPEHLVAMKVAAVRNAPDRGLRDLADLEYLLRLPGIDLVEARGFFEKAGLLRIFDWLGRRDDRAP